MEILRKIYNLDEEFCGVFRLEKLKSSVYYWHYIDFSAIEGNIEKYKDIPVLIGDFDRRDIRLPFCENDLWKFMPI